MRTVTTADQITFSYDPMPDALKLAWDAVDRTKDAAAAQRAAGALAATTIEYCVRSWSLCYAAPGEDRKPLPISRAMLAYVPNEVISRLVAAMFYEGDDMLLREMGVLQ